MGENFNVTWEPFLSYGKVMLRDLMETENFSDVILVSDDQHQFQVHKFILSSCSLVFKKILKNNPQNAIIYLRGIKHEELQSILEFIYFGETSIDNQRMAEFLRVARDLTLKEIGENFADYWNTKNVSGSSENLQMKIEDLKNEFEFNDEPLVDKEKLDHEKPIQTIDKLYACTMCNKKLSTFNGIDLHIKAAHNEVKYKCQQCDFQATQLSSVNQHVKYKHEGLKFPCHHCKHKSSTKSNLKIHIQRMHNK